MKTVLSGVLICTSPFIPLFGTHTLLLAVLGTTMWVVACFGLGLIAIEVG